MTIARWYSCMHNVEFARQFAPFLTNEIDCSAQVHKNFKWIMSDQNSKLDQEFVQGLLSIENFERIVVDKAIEDEDVESEEVANEDIMNEDE